MNEVNFTPQTDIEIYLNDELNISIYRQLTEDEIWKDTFEPLEFFNLLYDQFEILDANRKNPLSVKKHLLKLDLKKIQLFYLLYILHVLILQAIKKRHRLDPSTKELNNCWELIENDYKNLEDELFEKPEPVKKSVQPEIFPEQPKPIIKPIFSPEAIPVIFELLKDFFSPPHQLQLKEIMETGNDASEHLIFLGNGNRLADAFKQLIDSDIITGCRKKELESWICRNFKFRNRKGFTVFQPRYLQDIISANKDLCQNPILNITVEKSTGKILIRKI